MATVHAGVKRSYRQMHGIERASQSPASSREVSPLRRSSRDVSGPTGSRSGYVTPAHDWTELPRQVQFDSNASIVLVGVRGVGKSTLGVLAATAYGRRLVESERVFFEATGTSAQAYRKLHGAAEYHKKHYQILKRTLEAHSQDAVITCSFSDLESQGSMVLRDFAQTHPVIHVTRDAEGVQSHLQVWSLERTRQLLRASGPLLRSCTNFEFFNLSEKLADTSSQDVQDLAKSSGLFLTLKRVERDFLKALRNIIGDHERASSHHSAYPLSQVPVHDRAYTLCAVAAVDEIVEGGIDLDALQVGVDAVELSLPLSQVTERADTTLVEDDLSKAAKAFAIIRRSTILPIVLTAHKRSQSEVSPQAFAKLAGYCLRLAPEYCTIDVSLGDVLVKSLIAGKGRTKVIGMALVKEAPPNGWGGDECVAVYDGARQLGCDLIKITMPAKRLEDSFAAQQFRDKVQAIDPRSRVIAYNTGKNGRPSMCFNKILTPVKHSTPSTSTAMATDDTAMVTVKELFTSLFASFIYEPMNFFIYGATVSYSLSPAMHNAAYSACGMPHTFGKHSSSTLDKFKKLAREYNFGGAAVTQPYKTGVMPILDGLSSHAQAIGSVNTVIPVRELSVDGTLPDDKYLLSQTNRSGPVLALYGHNTDWIGIRACLRRGLSPANTVRPQTTALVCGAGGQARSTIYSLLSLGVRNVFLCNRTLKNAQILADHYNNLIDTKAISELDPANAAHTRVRVLESFESAWPKDFRQPSMIVSSIPTQTLEGTLTDFSIPERWLESPTGGVMVELAYRPMMTPIVAQMKARAHKGWIFMDGFDILPEQAFAQFELLTGRRAPRKLMRDEVIKRYREEQSQQGLSAQMRDSDTPGR